MLSCITFDELERQRRLLQAEPWYHHSLSRGEAENLLRVGGDFLVRESIRSPGVFVLSGKWNGRPFHMLVHCREERSDLPLVRFNYFFEYHKKSSIVELIQFHWANQVPMSRKSEAIICRPVRYIRSSFDVGSSHMLRCRESGCRGGMLRKRHLFHPSVPGLSASMNDLTATTDFVECSVDRTGTSVHDLSDNAYIEPSFLLIDPTHLEAANRDLTDKKLSSDSRSIVLIEPRVLPTKSVICSDVDNSKLSCLNRKQIRYVQMHESPSVTAMLMDSSDIGSCSEYQRNTDERCHEKLTPCLNSCDFAAGGLNYDLTLPLVGELLSCVGPVYRALSPDVWRRLSLLFSTRSLTPFSYAHHLTARSISLLASLSCTCMTDAADQSSTFSSSVLIREHLLVRDRYYCLFIIATVLFAETLEARTWVVVFWLDVAQCLLSILCDQHTLNFVRRAILSPQITSLSDLWDNVLRNCNKANAAMLQLWREEQAERDSSTEVHYLNPDISSHLEKHIPNFIPFLRHSFEPDFNTESSRMSEQFLRILNSLHNDCWMFKLTAENLCRKPLLVFLSQTETILALLLGPIRLQNISELDTLAIKLERVLTEIAAISSTSYSNLPHKGI